MSCDVDLHHVKWMKAMLPTRERPVYTMHVSVEKAGEAGVYHRCWVWPRVKGHVPTASWPASEGVRGSWPYPLGKSRPVTAKKHCGNFADNLSYPASLIILSVKFDPGGIDHTISLSPQKSKTKKSMWSLIMGETSTLLGRMQPRLDLGSEMKPLITETFGKMGINRDQCHVLAYPSSLSKAGYLVPKLICYFLFCVCLSFPGSKGGHFHIDCIVVVAFWGASQTPDLNTPVGVIFEHLIQKHYRHKI